MINVLKELCKERKKIKLLEKELGQVKESTQDITTLGEMRKDFMDLRAKLEESKVNEVSLREQLEEKEETQEKLEREIVSLKRNLEKENIKRKYDKSIEILNQIINNQDQLMTNQDLDTARKMRSIKLGHGTPRSMKQALHSQRMKVNLQGMNMYKKRKP